MPIYFPEQFFSVERFSGLWGQTWLCFWYGIYCSRLINTLLMWKIIFQDDLLHVFSFLEEGFYNLCRVSFQPWLTDWLAAPLEWDNLLFRHAVLSVAATNVIILLAAPGGFFGGFFSGKVASSCFITPLAPPVCLLPMSSACVSHFTRLLLTCHFLTTPIHHHLLIG